MTRRRYNPRAVQRRANDRAEDRAHDERVWEAERKRLAAEAAAAPLTRCAANRDGECGHAQCPQLRDNEPAATGRHCPLDNNNED